MSLSKGVTAETLLVDRCFDTLTNVDYIFLSHGATEHRSVEMIERVRRAIDAKV